MTTRVLIIEARRKCADQLRAALELSGFQVVGTARDTDDLAAVVMATAPDAILIDADSPSRDTLEHLAALNERFPKPMVMLSDNADVAMVRAAAQAGVSAYLADGISPPHLRSLLNVASVHFQGRRALQSQLVQAQQALDDRVVVERAKRLLMEREGLSESDSYIRLRRVAMSRSQRISDVARILLGQAEAAA